jgi:hypothetical protein
MLTAKTAVFIALTMLVAAPAAGAMPMHSLGGHAVVMRVDWQGPMQLPRRFRNHCSVENFTGRPYCSNHCGADYQFYYCSQASFGCCHLGHGYCSGNSQLRCTP